MGHDVSQKPKEGGGGFHTRLFLLFEGANRALRELEHGLLNVSCVVFG